MIDLRIETLASQDRFLASQAKFRGFSGPVGSGKTRGLCYLALMCVDANPGCVGLIGAPTYPMLEDVTLPAMKGFLDECGIQYRYNKQSHSMLIRRNGSQILFRSLDHPERLRGSNLAWVGVDELTYCKQESWLRLEARVRDPKARKSMMFAVWTPKGFDWVYRRFISPDRLPSHEAILAQPRENSFMLAGTPDYYKNLESSYDDLFFRQEVMGEYLNVHSGRTYHAFTEDNVKADLTYTPHSRLLWSLDFNVNPMTSIIAQHVNGEIRILEEIVIRNSNTIEMCEQFRARCAKYQKEFERCYPKNFLEVGVFGDASGKARSTAARSDYDLITEYFRSDPGIRIKLEVPRSNPAVRDRVNSVNAQLKNAAGRHGTFIDPSCRELITDLYEVAWKTGSANFQIDKSDGKRTHLSDALGYLIWEIARINGFVRENQYN